MEPAGYSATPLPRKLGLKDGMVAGFIGLPATLDDLTGSAALARCDRVAEAADLPAGPYDYLHIFDAWHDRFAAAIPLMRARLARNGMIWTSWPKRAAKLPTDVTEDSLRALALADILVDVKVCAVDQVWSGLKLVIRKEARLAHVPLA